MLVCTVSQGIWLPFLSVAHPVNDAVYVGLTNAKNSSQFALWCAVFGKYANFKNFLFAQFVAWIAPAIICLFFESGPSAIAWLVVTIVVNAFYLHSCRTGAHVCQEIRKTCAPSGAHCNAARAVTWE